MDWKGSSANCTIYYIATKGCQNAVVMASAEAMGKHRPCHVQSLATPRNMGFRTTAHHVKWKRGLHHHVIMFDLPHCTLYIRCIQHMAVAAPIARLGDLAFGMRSSGEQLEQPVCSNAFGALALGSAGGDG